MIDQYNTCKIKPGKVLLNKLAEHFGLLPAELRWFHNRFCPIEDLIDPDIQPHVEIIYVPVPGIETGYYATAARKKPVYEKANTLAVPKSFEKRYGIKQILQEDGNELTLHYETELKKTDADQLTVTRNHLYINHQRPDTTLEQIAEEAGRVFYPLQLELYGNAKLKHIANFPEIQKRWKAKKAELALYYKGEIAAELLKLIDEQLEYRGKTQRGILDSWFFILYFFPLYEQFNDEKKYTFQASLPVLPKMPRVLFDITLSIEEEVSETQKFIITAKGECTDPRTADEIAHGKAIHNPEAQGEKAAGSFEFTYKLNAKDNSVFSIWGEIQVQLSKQTRKISFECYEQ